MNIPKDPIMLMSFLNTHLRDEFSSFEELTKAYIIDDALRKEIETKLEGAGYRYNSEKNQFVNN